MDVSALIVSVLEGEEPCTYSTNLEAPNGSLALAVIRIILSLRNPNQPPEPYNQLPNWRSRRH
jgi:hypothetical protein